MQPTVQTLIAAGIAPTAARLFAEPLARACAQFGIDTPVRLAAFVAQTGHESAGFTALEESLYYRLPERIRAMWPTRVPSLADAATLVRNPQALANRVYSNRNGNGGPETGDGWKYRGRGLLQITGRANYEAASESAARDYVSQPDLVAQPEDACLTAAWFWATAGCNLLADGSQIDAITRRINGPAMAGADDRRERFREALVAFQGAHA